MERIILSYWFIALIPEQKGINTTFLCIVDHKSYCHCHMKLWYHTWQVYIILCSSNTLLHWDEHALCMLCRWRCPRWSSCCHSWRSWAAAAHTCSPTLQLLSASQAWSTRDLWVCWSFFPLLAESLLSSNWLRLKAEMFFLISPTGESLDSSLQRTMHRVCSELDCPSSLHRTQAFTLMIWVRFTHYCLCKVKDRW